VKRPTIEIVTTIEVTTTNCMTWIGYVVEMTTIGLSSEVVIADQRGTIADRVMMMAWETAGEVTGTDLPAAVMAHPRLDTMMIHAWSMIRREETRAAVIESAMQVDRTIPRRDSTTAREGMKER